MILVCLVSPHKSAPAEAGTRDFTQGHWRVTDCSAAGVLGAADGLTVQGCKGG